MSKSKKSQYKKGIWRITVRAIVSLAVLSFLAACATAEYQGKKADGALQEAGHETARLQIVSTIFPQYDFARKIAGGEADVCMLLKPGEEVHSYEPTPQDIRMIQNCDLFIYTGGENDIWVENILETVREDVDSPPRAVRLLDLVETYEEEHLEGMMPEKGGHDHEVHDREGHDDHDHDDHDHEDHDHEEHEGEGHEDRNHDHDDQDHEDHSHEDHDHEEEPDEHVWTSPENCAVIIEKLMEELCELDPAHADTYRANGDAYRAEFGALDEEYREMIGAAEKKTIIFGDRFPFRYLAEEFGLTCYAAFSGCSAESEPSAATVAFLIDKTVEEAAPVVFKIEFSNGNIARAIAEAAQVKLQRQAKKARAQQQSETAGSGGRGEPDAKGAAVPQIRVMQLHSCHNVTRDEFAAGETCLSLMRQNLEALRTALGSPVR